MLLKLNSQGIPRNRQRRIRGKMEKSSQSKFFFFLFAVQDFLDKAKKEFEEQWSKNIKVRQKAN